MPPPGRQETYKQRLRHVGTGQNSLQWECPHCSQLIFDLRGGKSRHETACLKRQQNMGQASAAGSIDSNSEPLADLSAPIDIPLDSDSVPAAVEANQDLLLGTELDRRPAKRQRHMHHQGAAPGEGQDGGLNHQEIPDEIVGAHNEAMDQETPLVDAIASADWNDRSSVPESIEEGLIWVRRHPCASLPSGFQTDGPNETSEPMQQKRSPESQRPPFYPFSSFDDFDQARIFIKNGSADGHITEQLQYNARRHQSIPGATALKSPKNAKEFHQVLARAHTAEGLKFETHTIITEHKGNIYTHYVRVRSLWKIAKEVLKDPDLTQHLVFMPEQIYIRNPQTESGNAMLIIEEVWHSRDWWNAQTRIGRHGYILYIQLYIDSTHLTTIGDVKVWPVYVWFGNVPAELRKRRGKGGAALVGYLPFVGEHKELSQSNLAELRAQVYQQALAHIIESIKRMRKHGKLVRCSDGVVRNIFPEIGAISVDYEELMRILSLLGHQSGFPRPLCLVPKKCQGDLSGTEWPMRTYTSTMEVLEKASHANSVAEAKAIRRTQSLRKTTSALLLFMGPSFSAYNAIAIADPLHQIEQGVFGKHMWPKLVEVIGRTNCGILDQRFKDIPVHPDLKHFPNGVTSLKFIEGHEHATTAIQGTLNGFRSAP